MSVSEESRALLEATVRELFQAELSATRHPRVESARLGASPPGDAMEEIAIQAEKQLEYLEDLARLRGISPATAAEAIGRAFSSVWENLTDLTLTSEQSYRITLLGVRHGIDLVRVIHELAVVADDATMKTWSEAWLLRRIELVEQAEAELAWFVANPAQALEPANPTPLATIARTALRAFGRFDRASSAR